MPTYLATTPFTMLHPPAEVTTGSWREHSIGAVVCDVWVIILHVETFVWVCLVVAGLQAKPSGVISP